MLYLRACTHRVILGVPAVAQERMAKTARGDQRLGRAVFDRQVERIGVGMQDAGIGDKLHPCRFRRFDHGPMLRSALASFARRDPQIRRASCWERWCPYGST